MAMYLVTNQNKEYSFLIMMDPIEKSPEEVVREFKKKKELRSKIVIGVVIFLLAIYAFNSGSTSQNTGSVSVPTEVDTSWIPTEFNSYSDDPNIGWRWLEKNEFKTQVMIEEKI